MSDAGRYCQEGSLEHCPLRSQPAARGGGAFQRSTWPSVMKGSTSEAEPHPELWGQMASLQIQQLVGGNGTMGVEADFPTQLLLTQVHPQPVHTKVRFLDGSSVPGTAAPQLEGLNIGRHLVFSFKERYKSLQKYTVLNHFLFLGLPKSSLSLMKKKSMIREGAGGDGSVG